MLHAVGTGVLRGRACVPLGGREAAEAELGRLYSAGGWRHRSYDTWVGWYVVHSYLGHNGCRPGYKMAPADRRCSNTQHEGDGACVYFLRGIESSRGACSPRYKVRVVMWLICACTGWSRHQGISAPQHIVHSYLCGGPCSREKTSVPRRRMTEKPHEGTISLGFMAGLCNRARVNHRAAGDVDSGAGRSARPAFRSGYNWAGARHKGKVWREEQRQRAH